MYYYISKTVTNKGKLVGYMVGQPGATELTYIPKSTVITLCNSGLVANATADISGRVRGIGYKMADLPTVSIPTEDSKSEAYQNVVASWIKQATNGKRVETSRRAMRILQAIKQFIPKAWPNHEFKAVSIANTCYSEGYTVEDLYIICRKLDGSKADVVIATLMDGDDFVCGATDRSNGGYFSNYQNVNLTNNVDEIGRVIAEYFLSRV